MSTSPFLSLGMETPLEDLQALRELTGQAGHKPLQGQAIVEVGSWTGRTALALATHGGTVYCIDHWLGTDQDVTGQLALKHGSNKVFEAFCKNMGSLLLRKVFPCRGWSQAWAAVWPFPVDLVFIDADHAYGAVKADLAAWAPHVRRGGILCGHDYGLDFEGVTRAVDEFGLDGVLGRCVWWKRM